MIKLIIDSGSTKAEWILLDNSDKKKILHTEGMHPLFTDLEKLNHIIDNLENDFKKNIDELYFYGAGCLAEDGKKIIESVLKNKFPKSKILVESDLLGAARACFGNEKGISIISGTGSAVCYYDGEEIKNIRPSLGYILGDEGSGNHIGRKLLTDYFYGKMTNKIHQQFEIKYGLTREKVIHSIYKSDFPNRYLAAFSTFAADHISDAYIYHLVKKCFLELFESHIIPLQNLHPGNLGFNGSIAFIFQDILKELANENGMTISKIIKSPGEYLAKYHLQK